MISYHEDGSRSAAAAIEREIARFCDPSDEACLLAAREVARGVEAYLADPGSDGADTRHPRALATRALISTGRKDMAGRMLLAGGGLVRRSHSAVAGAGTVLVLDFARMAVKDEERLDLFLRRCLLLLLDSMAHLWDADSGRGMLGLRNIGLATSAAPRRDRRGGKANPSPREVMELCENRMDALKERRRWEARPLVLDMDWRANRRRKRRCQGAK